MKSLLNQLWHSSPADLWRAGRRRLRRAIGQGDHGWDYSIETVLASSKHMNSKMEIERWERLWRIAKLHGFDDIQQRFELRGKTLLEAGCGPVLGLGPMAIFRGADRFYYLEPDLSRSVVEHASIKRQYFRPMYQELVANYGNLRTFNDWYSRVMDQSKPLPVDEEDGVDFVFSHSVLEHIPRAQMASFLERLRRALKSGGWFVHTVDFGPHGYGGSEMSSLYRLDWANEPPIVNLLRRPDLESAIRKSGLDLTACLPYKVDDGREFSCHPSWRKYSQEDLAQRVIVFVGSKVV